MSHRRALSVFVLVACGPRVPDDAVETTGGAQSNPDAGDERPGTTVPVTTATSFTASTDSSADTTVATDPSTTSGDDSVSGTTGTPTGECTDNLVVDGGFEAGTPSTAWTEQSVNFGTPLCDSGCTADDGAVPYAGDWFVWFGGVNEPEHAAVGQDVVIAGPTAFLGFRLDINAAGGAGDDIFELTIDGATIFMLSDASMDAYDGYTPVSIDISGFADGASHTVTFIGDFPGTGLSNFFLDEVTLVSCVPDEGTSSSTVGSSTSTGSGSTDSGSSSGSTG